MVYNNRNEEPAPPISRELCYVTTTCQPIAMWVFSWTYGKRRKSLAISLIALTAVSGPDLDAEKAWVRVQLYRNILFQIIVRTHIWTCH